MSTASIRSSRISPTDKAEGSSGAVLRWGGILVALALLAFLFAWFMGWIRFTTDPRVVEIRKMQEEARQKFVANGGPNTLVEATEAVVAMAQIRQKVESLPENLRPQAERSGGSMFRTAMRARIDGYFALPPEKRQAELDRQIKQEEMMRKAFETAGAVAGAFGGGGGSSNAAAGGGAPRSRTEESRNNWRKQMIDRTTPEQRARYVEYRRAMEKRREQLGMPSGGPR